LEVIWLTGHQAKPKAFRTFRLKAVLNREREGKTGHGEKNAAMQEAPAKKVNEQIVLQK
jgi:hypothetical protein